MAFDGTFSIALTENTGRENAGHEISSLRKALLPSVQK